MSEYLWPPDIVPSAQDWRVLGNVASFESPFTGSIRTVSRSGGRLGCRLVVPPLKGTDRYRLMSILAALRDRSNYLWVPDFSTTRRGSFPASELLMNNDFSNGTNGWSTTRATASVTDRVMKVVNTKSAASYFELFQTTAPAVTQYAPHALRSFIAATSRSGMTGGVYFDGASSYGLNPLGMLTIASTATGTTAAVNPLVLDTAGNVSLAGDYGEVNFTSLSRCILVDAGPNALTYSDQIDNAAWSKTNCSVSANADTAPDGTSTADRVVENSASAPHYIQQNYTRASASEDVTVYGYFASAVGTRGVLLQCGSDTGFSNGGYAYFTLSGSGTVHSSGVFGTGTNAHASIKACGGGWYFCTLTSRLAASTNASFYAALTNSSPTNNYAGDSTSALAMWRCGLALSSVATRGAQTTSTAIASGASQSGTAIYVKGLPASTSGLLKSGDFVSCGWQGNIVTASLDSDSAGLGILQCALPWRAGLADNAPIIVHQPLVKMRPAGDIAWPTGPGQFSSFEIDLVEDIT